MRDLVELSLVTKLPKASTTRTVTAGLMAEPATALVGCCPKTNWLAAAGFTVTVTLPVMDQWWCQWRTPFGCRRSSR